MKRIARIVCTLLALATVAACTLSFAACGKKADDLETVRKNGKLVVGITEFAPMDYRDADKNWIGFDADAASAFAAYLGVEVEFSLIDWDRKTFELEAGTIDCVWNGMTLTDDVKAAMSTSKPYFNNAQVVIVRADRAADIKTAADCKGLTFAVEKGSAGEAAATANGFKITAVKDQATALTEVKAGTSDAAVVDFTWRSAWSGKGRITATSPIPSGWLTRSTASASARTPT